MTESLVFSTKEFPHIESGEVLLIEPGSRFENPVKLASDIPPEFDLQVVLQLVQICNQILISADRDFNKLIAPFLVGILTWNERSRKQYFETMPANALPPAVFDQITSLLQYLPIQLRACEWLCHKYASRGTNNLIHGNLFAQTNGLCGSSEELLAQGISLWSKEKDNQDLVRRVGDFLLLKGLDIDTGIMSALCVKDYQDEKGNIFLRGVWYEPDATMWGRLSEGNHEVALARFKVVRTLRGKHLAVLNEQLGMLEQLPNGILNLPEITIVQTLHTND